MPRVCYDRIIRTSGRKSMATQTLIRHGTDKGYRTEAKLGNVCERCRNAHRVYQTQFRPQGKAQGLKYSADDIIDHLYKASKAKPGGNTSRARVSRNSSVSADIPFELDISAKPEQEPEPSLGDRLSERIRGMMTGESGNNDYVPENDSGYVQGNPDVYDEMPDSREWEPADDAEYIINAAGMKRIEENLGTYLSVVGITVEMIDPYCGPILAQNFDNIVSRWSKVIAHYPKTAELFLDGRGGVIMTWIGALQATWPFLYAIYQH